MVRRVQANLNGDYYQNQNQDQSQNSYYPTNPNVNDFATGNNPYPNSDYSTGQFVQHGAYVDHGQTHDYQKQSQYQNDYSSASADYTYSAYDNGASSADQGYTSQSSSYQYNGNNGGNNYGGYSYHDNTGYDKLNSGHVRPNFPQIQPSPIQQTTAATAAQFSSGQYNYGSNQGQEVSWMSAFGSGGFPNEPPLLEELGINFSHIKDKTIASVNPFRKLDAGTLADADLTGPLLFCFLFGISLLFSGKVHFGYIYGVATLGWVSIYAILNLMSHNGVSFYLTASVLGYCLLPMVLLSALAILLKLRGFIGIILGITSVSWCTLSSSTIFVATFGMRDQQILIAYPIFLLYSCFALMTIF